MARQSAAVLFAALVALSSRSWAQPVNNACANAIPLAPNGSINGSTSGASVDGSADCGSSASTPDVWYSITVPCDGDLTVYTCPASYDTVISVHNSCPGTTFNQIGCNDDSLYCGTAYPRASAVSLSVQARTYLVRVSGFSGATGSFTLNNAFVAAAPGNDTCAGAYDIGLGTAPGSTICATLDGAADCTTFPSGPDVWYRYTATCTATLDLFICPASFDTMLSVHTGCPGTASNEIACNDDSAYCGTAYPLTSYIPLPVVAGQSYYIRVAGFNTTSGTFVLNASLNIGVPANDSCANAIPVGDGPTPFYTCGATTDGPIEPGLCNFFNHPQLDRDVWYRYTASCGGSASVDLCDSTYDSEVAIYNAVCPTVSGLVLACNDDACSTRSFIRFPTNAGQQYLIRIGGYSNSTGSGTMSISCCYPNCDGSMSGPILNVIDFACFLNRFAAGEPYANCDGSSTAPVLNVLDFSCFLNRFAAGCP